MRAAIAQNRRRIKEALTRVGVKRKGIIAPLKDLKALINKRPPLKPAARTTAPKSTTPGAIVTTTPGMVTIKFSSELPPFNK